MTDGTYPVKLTRRTPEEALLHQSTELVKAQRRVARLETALKEIADNCGRTIGALDARDIARTALEPLDET